MLTLLSPLPASLRTFRRNRHLSVFPADLQQIWLDYGQMEGLSNLDSLATTYCVTIYQDKLLLTVGMLQKRSDKEERSDKNMLGGLSNRLWPTSPLYSIPITRLFHITNIQGFMTFHLK